MNQSYLAFDLGASSGRAVLGLLEEEQLRMEEAHRFPTPLDERNGHLYWDLDALRREIQTGFERAIEQAPALRGVSVNSWGLDYVPLDERNQPVRNACCYRDPRTNGIASEVHARVPFAEFYGRTGIQFMEINTVYQMYADWKFEPELFRRTRRRLGIADYFNWLLCGRAASERSFASTTQLLDVTTGGWAGDLFERLGFPGDGWADIVPPGTRLGAPEGFPAISVVAGCSHDTACAVAAVPAEGERRDWAYISCGTWSLIGVELPGPILTEAARQCNFTNEAGLDGTIRFLKNLTGLWVLQECEREWREAGSRFTYSDLLEEARAADEVTEEIDLNDPRFSGRGNMEGKLKEYCRQKGLPVPESRGQVARSILRSLARNYRAAFKQLESLVGRPLNTIHLVGGGSQNDLLCQWTADACKRVVMAGPAEATAAGNLLIQARVLGALPRKDGIRRIVRASFPPRCFRPAHARP